MAVAVKQWACLMSLFSSKFSYIIYKYFHGFFFLNFALSLYVLELCDFSTPHVFPLKPLESHPFFIILTSFCIPITTKLVNKFFLQITSDRLNLYFLDFLLSQVHHCLSSSLYHIIANRSYFEIITIWVGFFLSIKRSAYFINIDYLQIMLFALCFRNRN